MRLSASLVLKRFPLRVLYWKALPSTNPAKVKAIVDWLVPRSQKDLRKWLGLANCLHKYSANYDELARPLSNLLRKDVDWCWHAEYAIAFKASQRQSFDCSDFDLSDPDRPFSVVCDASYFTTGSVLLQTDAEG